jgi:hypothetical protein
MAKDEREEEREFLAGLKMRTGRDLAEWMAAIAAQGFADKNEVIDWLREQGLPFARASWLERIHKNGGKPIYSSEPPKEAEQPAPLTPVPPPKPAQVPRPKPARPAASAPPSTEPETDALEKHLAAAKGYRPLYHLLEAEMRKAIPGLTISPRTSYLSIGAPGEFAALTLHATELRLGLALGERTFDPILQKARLKGPGPAITHMIVLTDARQINDDLIALLQSANRRVNG